MLIDRINAALLAALLAIAPCAANASQAALLSPTTGTVSGLQLTNNYNAALDALNTCNAGASAPTNQLSGTPSPGNCWLNTTASPYPYGIYDGAGWRVPFWVDAVNGVTNVKIGGGVASVASSATVDLCATAVAPRAYITLTGSTTITSFGATCSAGHVKIVTFAGSLTLTYNATSMIIPGAHDVPTSAGDQAVMMSLGGGNWQVIAYTPANGQALINPAIDVGSYVLTAAVNLPSSKYMWGFGQTVSRSTYATLLAATTITQSVGRTNGSAVLTGFTDTTQIGIYAQVEGAGIPPGAQIGSCTSTTCTMLASNATSSGTANVTIFPNGSGDGSTTFNLPNCAGVVLAGRDNLSGTPRGLLTTSMFGGSAATNPDSLGSSGGAQSHILSVAEMPAHSHSVNVSDPGHSHTTNQGTNQIAGFAGGNTIGGSPNTPIANLGSIAINASTTGINVSINNNGGGGAHSIVQPTLTVNCMVRVLALRDAPQHLSRRLAANDNMYPAIVDRRRRAA